MKKALEKGTMKKLALVLLMLTVIVTMMAACNKKDKSSDPAVGHWTHTYSIMKDGEIKTQSEPYKYTIDINADGTYESYLKDNKGTENTIQGEWTVKDANYTLINGNGSSDLILTLEDGKLLIKNYSGVVNVFENNVN